MNTSRKQRTWIPVIILILTGLLLIGGVSASEFGPWNLQTVASGGKVGQYSSVALDAAGNPAISYYDQTYGDLKYASWDGSKWVITTVDCSKSDPPKKHWWSFWDRGYDRTQDREYISCFHGTEKVGKYSSLAFDNSGKPRISYYDESKGDLKYASWDGSKWVVTTVSSAGKVGEYSSLAFDGSKPRISYFDESKDDLKYASWDGSKWVITTVDSAGKVGEYSSLALDGSGKPRISYYDETKGDLKYASWDGSRWVIITVDGSWDGRGQKRNNWDNDHHWNDYWSKRVGKYSSLALDSNGQPRISYYDQSNKDLKYAAFNGTTWIITTIDSTKRVGEYSSLKLDANGDPRISYYDASNKDLKFAAWDRTTARWGTETVDSSKKVGAYSSLALDSLGNPRISYYDQSNKDLKYAAGTAHTQPPTAPTVTGISPASGPLAGGTVVTITGTGFTGATAVMFGATAGTSLTVNSANKITITSPSGAAGTVDVTVITPVGTSAASPADLFTYSSAPTVTGITPATGVAGTTVPITNLAGTGFLSGATVKLTKSGSSDIIATLVTVDSPTQITCTLPLPAPSATSAGQWNVVVTNSDGQSATLTNGFTVTNSVPTVTGITPATGVAGTSVSVTNLAGTGFLTGATVKLTKSDASDITATSVTVDSTTKISCTLPLPAPSTTSAGKWNIVVTNTEGQSATLANGFTVTNPAPTVTGINPATGVAGTKLSDVSITGENFVMDTMPSAWLAKQGEDNIMATNVVVLSPTQITCNLLLTPYKNTLPGQWDLVVKNADGQSGSKIAAFALTNPAPVVTSIEPSTGINGSTITIIKVTGNNFGFGQNPYIWLAKTGQNNIDASSIQIYGTEQLSFTLIIPESAPAGTWDLMVRSQDGQVSANLGVFEITQKTGAAPMTWDWSVNGWDGWQTETTWTGTTGPRSIYGPEIVSGHGEYGSDVTSALGSTTQSSVWKTFTAPSDTTWTSLTFTGLLSSSDLLNGRKMTISVDGVNVYEGTAGQNPEINGQQFTITGSFTQRNAVTVKISGIQSPIKKTTSYRMQFNSLTLS